jgi:hypothetical protein
VSCAYSDWNCKVDSAAIPIRKMSMCNDGMFYGAQHCFGDVFGINESELCYCGGVFAFGGKRGSAVEKKIRRKIFRLFLLTKTR